MQKLIDKFIETSSAMDAKNIKKTYTMKVTYVYY